MIPHIRTINVGKQGRPRPPWVWMVGENCTKELRLDLVLEKGEDARFAERREGTLGERITS